MFDLHTISFLLIFIAAGLVKGVTGMGLPTVAMGLAWPADAAAGRSGAAGASLAAHQSLAVTGQARRWRRLYAVSGL